MENLNAEMVKRGLECCKGSYDCFTCDIYKRGCAGWRDGLAKDALVLINSQEQRIKELTEERDGLYRLVDDKIQENKRLTEDYKTLDMEFRTANTDLHATRTELTRVQEENARLKLANALLKLPKGNIFEITEAYARGLKTGRADTVEEYRKRVYRKMEKYTVFGREYIQRIMREVEKEMAGE